MASFGTVGRLTTCPRCKGRNAVVEIKDAYGFSKSCLYCGWYGYADERDGSDGKQAGTPDLETEVGRGEEERVAVSS